MKRIISLFLSLILIFTFAGQTMIQAKDNIKNGKEELEVTVESIVVEGVKINFVNSDKNSPANKEFLEILKKDLKKKSKSKKEDVGILYIPGENPDWILVSKEIGSFYENNYDVIKNSMVGIITTTAGLASLSFRVDPKTSVIIVGLAVTTAGIISDSVEPDYTTTYLYKWWSDYYNEYVYRNVVYRYQTEFRNTFEIIDITLGGILRLSTVPTPELYAL